MSPVSVTFWTWVAIGVLAGGSLVVFGWFLRDARRLMNSLKDGGEGRGKGEG